jgi:predicted GH43/DUF377 family glycosyl hydrolase
MKWNKLGRVFNPLDFPDRPEWMHEYAQAPATLVFDDFVRVYFSCRPKRGADGQFVSYSAFVDLDRKNLFKIVNIAQQPVFELGKLGTFDEFGIYPMSVIRNGREVWAYYAGWTRCESVPFNVAIGFGRSDDNGVTFKKLGDGPLLEYSPDEPFTMSGPKVRLFNDKFFLFYIAGDTWILKDGRPEISHKIRMATSADGMNWSKHHKNLISDNWGQNESQASPDVFYANGKYHMFFCGWVPRDFRQSRLRKIGYACSTDLVNWIRDDSKAGIDVSEFGFDNEMVAYPHVFELDSQIYMLYLGNQVGRFGFGLAQLDGELV